MILAFIINIFFINYTFCVQDNSSTKGQDETVKRELSYLDSDIFLVCFYRRTPGVTPAGAIAGPVKPYPDLQEVLAETYTRIDPNGKIFTKVQEIASSRGSKLSKHSATLREKTQIQLYENFALVRSVITIANMDVGDSLPNGRYWIVSTYRKDSGKWTLVLSQWTPYPL